jgi:hypothetical protein
MRLNPQNGRRNRLANCKPRQEDLVADLNDVAWRALQYDESSANLYFGSVRQKFDRVAADAQDGRRKKIVLLEENRLVQFVA